MRIKTKGYRQHGAFGGPKKRAAKLAFLAHSSAEAEHQKTVRHELKGIVRHIEEHKAPVANSGEIPLADQIQAQRGISSPARVFIRKTSACGPSTMLGVTMRRDPLEVPDSPGEADPVTLAQPRAVVHKATGTGPTEAMATVWHGMDEAFPATNRNHS